MTDTTRERETTPVDAPGAERRWLLLVGAAHALIFGPIAFNALFRPALNFPNLWLWHADQIPETFRGPLNPVQPHFGWHLASRVVDLPIPGTDPRLAGALTWALASAAFGVALYVVLRRTDEGRPLLAPGAALAASLAVALVESPAALQGFEALMDPSTRFLPMYYRFVPTTIVSMAPNVVMVWFTALLIDGRLGSRAQRALPPIIVVAAIAKPNLVPSLATVAPALAWLSARGGIDGGHQRVVATLRLVTLPAVAVTAFQFAILLWFSPPFLTGGITLRPGWEFGEFGGYGWQFWLLCLFPVVALLLVRSPLLDRSVQVSIGLFIVGFGASFLLARSGDTHFTGAVGGDILQMAAAAATVLFIFAVRRILVLRQERRVSPVVLGVLALVLVPYLAAGAATWRCQAAGAACYPPDAAPTWPPPQWWEAEQPPADAP